MRFIAIFVLTFDLIGYSYSFGICSENLKNQGCFPIEYTCDAQNKPEPNPSVTWDNMNIGTAQSFVLMMDDPVTEEGTPNTYHVHWFVKDIPINILHIDRDATNQGKVPGVEAKKYGGPCGGPENKYRLTIYALPNATLDYIIGEKLGSEVDPYLRSIALAVASMRVFNYRNNQRQGMEQIQCPDDPVVCDTNGTQIFAVVPASSNIVQTSVGTQGTVQTSQNIQTSQNVITSSTNPTSAGSATMASGTRTATNTIHEPLTSATEDPVNLSDSGKIAAFVGTTLILAALL